jgi:hypothetical protein
MEIKKALLRKLAFLVCGMFVLGMMGCAASPQQSQDGKFLKYNFHYYSRGRDNYMVASIVNYVNCPNHGFLPYNTEVRVGRYRRGFKLRVVETGGLILVDAPRKYLGLKTTAEYLDLILSPNPVSYTDLSEIDQKGISSGKPIKGMSRKGIMISLGYPAPSFTPVLDSDVWHYWNSRFIKCNVHFKDGEVEYISRVD